MRKMFTLALAAFAGLVPVMAAQAADKPVLTIYTYDSFASEWGPGPAVEKAFEATCDCDLNFVALDSSIGILGRVQLEGASSKADIVLGLDNNLMATARETGLFADHGVKLSGRTALPVEFSDDVFVPFDWGHFAFVYNAETMPTPPGIDEGTCRRAGRPSYRDSGSADLDSRSRALAMGAVDLWRQRAGSVGRPCAKDRDRDKRVVGCLLDVP